MREGESFSLNDRSDCGDCGQWDSSGSTSSSSFAVRGGYRPRDDKNIRSADATWRPISMPGFEGEPDADGALSMKPLTPVKVTKFARGIGI